MVAFRSGVCSSERSSENRRTAWFKSASHRDYKGVFEQDKPFFSNIATAYKPI